VIPVEQTDGNANATSCQEFSGPRPFVTRRVFKRSDGSLTEWHSRHHRKGLVRQEVARAEAINRLLIRCLWMPAKLNWWIGMIFALGSLLFAAGSVLSLSSTLAARLSLETESINAIFFAGSIPFTVAAYLQLFQAANASPFALSDSGAKGGIKLVGWKPKDIGWLSCALQFPGTVLFNFNTFDAMIPSLTWFEEDLVIWVPNIVGSMLFLASGYLAFAEACHGYWGWQPRRISWWCVFINLLGCVGFLISALFSIVFPGPPDEAMVTLAVVFTLQGAICFFIGSLLTLPEAALEGESMDGRQNSHSTSQPNSH
jgi:hypothetical protein